MRGAGNPDIEIPTFCEHCGKPFPWTEKTLVAVDELTAELEGLSPDERGILKSSIHDIIQQNPHQSVAELHIKKLSQKIGAEGARLLRNLLQNYASGHLLKSLFGG